MEVSIILEEKKTHIKGYFYGHRSKNVLKGEKTSDVSDQFQRVVDFHHR